MWFSEKISVVMPTYNTPIPILREATESVLNQSFRDFEFIIVDDGSTNGADSYLRSLKDERVKIIWNPKNLGIAKSLNIGLRAAEGKYIARMDADDVSLPKRFEKQYAHMEKTPQTVLCGTNALAFDAKTGAEDKLLWKDTRGDMESFRIRSLFNMPGPGHPTWFIRHETLKERNLWYDENWHCVEDCWFLTQISQFGDVRILEEILLKYRISNLQISSRRKFFPDDKNIRKKLLAESFGELTEEELETHANCSPMDAKISPEALSLYRKLIAVNKTKKIFNPAKFEAVIYRRLAILICNSWTSEMTKKQKVLSLFDNLPVWVALKKTAGILKLKEKICRCVQKNKRRKIND